MCLAILVGGAAAGVLQAPAGPVAHRRAPRRLSLPSTPLRLQLAVPHSARGDPALLQVFRR